MPSCTVAGAFGIARTTGRPSPSPASMAPVGIAAATERTVCSASTTRESRRAAVEILRLDGDDDEARAAHGLGVVGRHLDAVTLANSSARSSRRAVATISPDRANRS